MLCGTWFLGSSYARVIDVSTAMNIHEKAIPIL
jgi:hypothetical protein